MAGTDSPWLTGLVDNGGETCVDGLSVHPYVANFQNPPPWPFDISGSARKLADWVDWAHDMVLRKTDRDIPVYVTEEGVPDSDRGQDAQAQYLTAVVNALKSSTYIKASGGSA